jgi:beta-glucosidase-like glycosyl hydrolase
VGPNVHAALVQGGVDYNCGEFYQSHLFEQLQAGFVQQADVDRAIGRVLRTMFRLGMFDAQDEQPLTKLGPEVVDTSASTAVSLQAATESIVLLENDGVLPLSLGKKGTTGSLSLAFIGPLANATQDMLSAPQYHGGNTLVNSHSPLQVAQRRGWSVVYEKGCEICDVQPPGYPNMPCLVPRSNASKAGFEAAVAAAKAASVAVLFLGNDQTTEARTACTQHFKPSGIPAWDRSSNSCACAGGELRSRLVSLARRTAGADGGDCRRPTEHSARASKRWSD